MVYLRNYDADFFAAMKADIRGLTYFVGLVGRLSESNLDDVKACFAAGKTTYPTFASTLEATVLTMKSTILTYMERNLQPANAVVIPNSVNVLSVDEIIKYLAANSSDTLVVTTAAKIINGDYNA